MLRTHNCGELRLSHIGNSVTLCGWVQAIRKLGSITFITLRDRYGLTQLFLNEEKTEQIGQLNLGREYVLQVSGQVIERSSKNVKMPTGDIELDVQKVTVLNAALTPPFTIEEESDGGEELRMQYRFLDLRRSPLQQNIILRYQVTKVIRQYLDAQGFYDIETPFLIKSTPEGARDFVVPSRMNEGLFYALPQSPQTFKQLLMVSGFDRYFQIVKCFRDEDLRADRQPEFTQVDCELTFVEQEDILVIFEGLLKEVLQVVKGVTLTENFPRISWEEAMWDYGNDKPDLRFDMKIKNLKTRHLAHCTVLKEIDFPVFTQAESILAISAAGCSDYSRKQTDALVEWVKRPQIGMNGLLFIKVNQDGTYKSSADKFLNAEQQAAVADYCQSNKGDLILLLAGEEEKTRKAMSSLRLYMGAQLNLIKENVFKPLWVIDFPLLEEDKETNKWMARHHPFTAPKPEQVAWMDEPAKYGDIKANAYDLVLNGSEIGGGSIRIYQKELQQKMFSVLGLSAEEAEAQFGFLLGAFQYGAPPHGGIALGLDRLCALISGQDSIRDFIAFPKNNSGRDVMLDAPAALNEEQLKELHLKITEEK